MILMVSTVFKILNFRLLWRSSNAAEQEVGGVAELLVTCRIRLLVIKFGWSLACRVRAAALSAMMQREDGVQAAVRSIFRHIAVDDVLRRKLSRE